MNLQMGVQEEMHVKVTRQISPRTTLENRTQKELIDNRAATGNQDSKVSKRLSISEASNVRRSLPKSKSIFKIPLGRRWETLLL